MAQVTKSQHQDEPVYYAKALYDFTGKDSDDLNFEEEDIIKLTSTETISGWLYGENDGYWGWFPVDWVKILSSEEARNLHNSEEDYDAKSPTEPITPQPATNLGRSASTGGWFSKYKYKNRKDDSVINAENVETAEKGLPKHNKGVTKNIAELIKSGKSVALVGAPAVSRQTWTDFIGGTVKADSLGVTKQERQRQEVIFELLLTERDYVDDLEITIDVYIQTLRKNKFLTPKDISIIFSNIEAILPVNKELLKHMNKRQEDSKDGIIEQIGDVFIRMSDYLKMYTMYCSNHPYAIMKLQANMRKSKAFTKFLEHSAGLPECRNLNLTHFLLRPVQRICKYPLLLREIIKNTPSDHPDSANLIKALLKIETVVTIVNEGARQAEAVHKMIEIQSRFSQKVNIVAPSRTIKKFGSIDVLSSHGSETKKRELFLFNDMLLVAKSYDLSDKLKVVDIIPFDMMLVNSIPDEAGTERNLIEVVHIGSNKFVLSAEDSFSKDMWMAAFNDVIQAWLAAKSRNIINKPSISYPLETLSSKVDGSAAPQISISEPQLASPGDMNDRSYKSGSVTDDSDSQSPNKIHDSGADVSVKATCGSIDTIIKESKPTSTESSILPSTMTLHRAISEHMTKPSPLLLPKPNVNNTSIATNSAQITTPKPHLPMRSASVKLNSNLGQAHGRLYLSSSRIASNNFIVQDAQLSSLMHSRSQSAGPTVTQPKPVNPVDDDEFKQHTRSSSLQPSRDSFESPSTIGSGGPKSQDARDVKISATVRERQELLAKVVFARPAFSQPGSLNHSPVKPTSGTSSLNSDLAEDDGLGELPQRLHMMNRPVKQVVITDVVRKAKYAMKSWVYTLSVNYVGFADAKAIIYHAYEDFFDFHMNLVGHFPEEAGLPITKLRDFSAGSEMASERIIPELPSQMMFVSETVARTRIGALQIYLDALLRLPAKISRSPHVLQFFKTNGRYASESM